MSRLSLSSLGNVCAYLLNLANGRTACAANILFCFGPRSGSPGLYIKRREAPYRRPCVDGFAHSSKRRKVLESRLIASGAAKKGDDHDGVLRVARRPQKLGREAVKHKRACLISFVLAVVLTLMALRYFPVPCLISLWWSSCAVLFCLMATKPMYFNLALPFVLLGFIEWVFNSAEGIRIAQPVPIRFLDEVLGYAPIKRKTTIPLPTEASRSCTTSLYHR
jgi:hypothetical protein